MKKVTNPHTREVRDMSLHYPSSKEDKKEVGDMSLHYPFELGKNCVIDIGTQSNEVLQKSPEELEKIPK